MADTFVSDYQVDCCKIRQAIKKSYYLGMTKEEITSFLRKKCMIKFFAIEDRERFNKYLKELV